MKSVSTEARPRRSTSTSSPLRAEEARVQGLAAAIEQAVSGRPSISAPAACTTASTVRPSHPRSLRPTMCWRCSTAPSHETSYAGGPQPPAERIPARQRARGKPLLHYGHTRFIRLGVYSPHPRMSSADQLPARPDNPACSKVAPCRLKRPWPLIDQEKQSATRWLLTWPAGV